MLFSSDDDDDIVQRESVPFSQAFSKDNSEFLTPSHTKWRRERTYRLLMKEDIFLKSFWAVWRCDENAKRSCFGVIDKKKSTDFSGVLKAHWYLTPPPSSTPYHSHILCKSPPRDTWMLSAHQAPFADVAEIPLSMTKYVHIDFY